MIDKNQWIKFYNLDTENLKEVFDFIDFRVDVRRLFPKCKWGDVCEQNAFNPLVEEKIWSMAKRSQGYLRTEQRKFRQLVDIWLDEIEPILKKWPQETVTDIAILEVDEAISAEQDKEFRLKPLKLKPLIRLKKQAKRKISVFIDKINSIASKFQPWKVEIDYDGRKLKMVNYTQELDDTQMTEWEWWDDITISNQIDITGIDITGNSHITNLIIEIFTDFINAIIDGSQIQICKRDSCENIFLKSGKGSGKRKYCSECSWWENKKEENKEVYQNICYLIDKWMGREYSRCAKASELKNYLKEIAEREGITDTPFLSGITAKNLGQYLRHIKKMLEDEYRIECHREREGSDYTYYFTKIQL